MIDPSLDALYRRIYQWQHRVRNTLRPGGQRIPETKLRNVRLSTGEMAFPSEWPEDSANVSEILEALLTDIFPANELPGHPRYYAYLAGGNDPLTGLGALAASALNTYTAHAHTAPGARLLEDQLIRWLCDAVGYGHIAGGWLTSGSSPAMLMALNAFRQHHQRHHRKPGYRIVYAESSHHAITRMAAFAGFAPEDMCRIRARDHVLDVNHLVEVLMKTDPTTGVFVVATAGTTTLGRVDDLASIVECCSASGAWMHVDAAYGFPFSLLPERQALFAAMSRADSINLDFHKSFSMPYGIGCLLVRDAALLQIPKWEDGSYMPPTDRSDPADFAPELSRPFRGLPVWLTLRCRGLSVFREQLRGALDNANQLAALLRQGGIPESQLLLPELTVVGVLIENRGEEILSRINRRGRVFLSGCTVNRQFCLRVCALTPEATFQDMECCAAEILRAFRDCNE